MANTIPTANNDTYEVYEDDLLNVKKVDSVLKNDEDPDPGDKASLATTLVSGPANLLFQFKADGTFLFDARNFDYLSAGEKAEQTFTYKDNDGQGESNVATVTITIIGVNDDPLAADDTASTSTSSAVAIDVKSNDSDVDHLDTLSIVALGDIDDLEFDGTDDPAGAPDNDPDDGLTITTDTGGTVTLQNDGTLLYTPADGFFGVDSFTYTIDDGNGGQDTATVEGTVTPGNVAPDAQDDT